MATISVGMSRLYRSQAAFLASESARAVQLSTAYAQEKARADMHQEKMIGFNFNKKKRLGPTLSNESLTQATQSIVAALPVPEIVPGSARASNGSLLETKPPRMWMFHCCDALSRVGMALCGSWWCWRSA